MSNAVRKLRGPWLFSLSTVLSLACMPTGSHAQSEATVLLRQGKLLAAEVVLQQQLESSSGQQIAQAFHLANAQLEIGRVNLVLYQQSLKYGRLYYQALNRSDELSAAEAYHSGFIEVLWGTKTAATARFSHASKFSDSYGQRSKAWLQALAGQTAISGNQLQKLEFALAIAVLNPETNINEQAVSADVEMESHEAFARFCLLVESDRLDRAKVVIESAGFTQNLLNDVVSKRTAAGVNVKASYFHPLALKYLAQFYLATAMINFDNLYPRLEQENSKITVQRRRGLACFLFEDSDLNACLGNTSDAYLLNLLGRIEWKSKSTWQAKERWSSNLTGSTSPEVRAYAAWCLAHYAGEFEIAISNAESAATASYTENKTYSQEISRLLAQIYVMADQASSAAFELDRGYNRSNENELLFLLDYASIMFENGRARHAAALDGAYRLQLNHPPARQFHYYLQGLVAENINSSDGRGIKGLD